MLKFLKDLFFSFNECHSEIILFLRDHFNLYSS